MEKPPQSNYRETGLSNDRALLREVATSQRHIMFCILGQIGYLALSIATAPLQNQVLYIVLWLLTLGILGFMIMSVVKLAKALGLSVILFVILMFVPCVSLIAMLSLSGKATARLTQAGIKVGFLGADPNTI